MKFIPNAVSRTMARQLLITQKHSPQLLFVGGMVGMGATIVLACRATLKIDGVLDQAQKDLANVGNYKGTEVETEQGIQAYSDLDARKDKAIIYTRTTVGLLKIYAPAISVGLISIVALAEAHRILNLRNAALTAAYGTIAKAYQQYRERVQVELGEEREKEIYYNLEPCEIEDPETGNTIEVKRVGDGTFSPYARLYDQYNRNYGDPADYNIVFLRMSENSFNTRLNAQGHLFLNEVYDDLGLERSKEGAVVGWVKGNGDNYVDLGIFRAGNEDAVIDFMKGRKTGIWLDFNVDGVIYDKI